MEPKIRVWVVFGKQLKLGAGRAQLLRLIDERGSLRKAAAEFGMSYRNAWGYLQSSSGPPASASSSARPAPVRAAACG